MLLLIVLRVKRYKQKNKTAIAIVSKSTLQDDVLLGSRRQTTSCKDRGKNITNRTFFTYYKSGSILLNLLLFLVL